MICIFSREGLINTNPVFNDNGTLTFMPRRLLKFMPELSVGDPKVDRVICPNIPLLVSMENINMREKYLLSSFHSRESHLL